MKNTVLDEVFLERFSSLFKEQGWTQKEFGEKVGLTESAISHYLKGDRKPKGSYLAKIATALGTTPEFLSPNASTEKKTATKAEKPKSSTKAATAAATKKSEKSSKAAKTTKTKTTKEKAGATVATKTAKQAKQTAPSKKTIAEIEKICSLLERNISNMTAADKKKITQILNKKS